MTDATPTPPPPPPPPPTPTTPSPAAAEPEGISPLILIGAFFLAFAACVLLGIAFTKTPEGRVVNGICGGVFLLIGIAFVAGGRRGGA